LACLPDYHEPAASSVVSANGGIHSRSLIMPDSRWLARDVASVLDFRIRNQVDPLVPQPPRPWTERVPEVADPERQRHLADLAAAMDARKERIGEHALGWAVHALGPVPEDLLDRLEWERRASDIGAYRQIYSYDHPTEPIGPEPAGDSPDKRAAWHGAFASLRPMDGIDLRGLPDGALLHRRGAYETETAWAPRHVGGELRQIRMSADQASQNAVRSQAEERVARERWRPPTGTGSPNSTRRRNSGGSGSGSPRMPAARLWPLTPSFPNADDELLHPAYWLVHSVDWPGGDLVEAAVAFAPSIIPRDALSWSAFQILGCADLYARKRSVRVIFFSDLTRMFADAGHSWAQLGVNWEAALRELEDGPFPAMFLTISERAYNFISSPALHMLVIGAKGVQEATEGE
jgi:hypothetical protein